MTITLIANTDSEMQDWGARLAACCQAPMLIYLSGELGAGKTTFVRGFLGALGHQGLVKSPTYTLIEPYQWDDRLVYHLDLYRLKTPSELDHLGFWDLLQEKAIVLIEWPSCGGDRLPEPDFHIVITTSQDQNREINLTAKADKAILLKHLTQHKANNRG